VTGLCRICVFRRSSGGARLVDGPRSGDRVKLVRVVQHRRLGGSSGAGIVMNRYGVKQLRSNLCFHRRGPFLDQPKAEVDMTEQSALLGRAEGGPALELVRPPNVVQESRREHEVGAQARMQLEGLAAQRRYADRVLEQTACVRVMRLRGRQRSQSLPQGLVLDEPRNRRAQPRMGHLRSQELQEPVELRRVAAQSRGEIRRIRLLRGFEGTNLQLKPVAKALDATEHANSVAFAEAAVQQFHVGPNPSLDATAWVDELQREVRRAAFRAPPLLARDRVDALDDPVFG
jgi:hypothetical protein